jgi:hypothetical protein
VNQIKSDARGSKSLPQCTQEALSGSCDATSSRQSSDNRAEPCAKASCFAAHLARKRHASPSTRTARKVSRSVTHKCSNRSALWLKICNPIDSNSTCFCLRFDPGTIRLVARDFALRWISQFQVSAFRHVPASKRLTVSAYGYRCTLERLTFSFSNQADKYRTTMIIFARILLALTALWGAAAASEVRFTVSLVFA